jgi:heat shock protein HslJ
MRPWNLLALFVVSVALLTGGCFSKKTKPAPQPKPSAVSAVKANTELKSTSEELKGTSWKVTRYNDGQGGMTDVIVGKGRTLTALFGYSKRFSGSAGCNNYVAHYTYSPTEKTFSFEMISMTTKQCETDVIMEQEGQFMAALYTAVSFRITGNTLTLNDDSGNPAVILTRN